MFADHENELKFLSDAYVSNKSVPAAEIPKKMLQRFKTLRHFSSDRDRNSARSCPYGRHDFFSALPG